MRKGVASSRGGRRRRSGVARCAVTLFIVGTLTGCASDFPDKAVDITHDPDIPAARPGEVVAQALAGSRGPDAAAGANVVPGDANAGTLIEAEIYTGTGELIDLNVPRTVASVDNDGTVSFNFVNAPVTEVVDVILGKALGLNYVIDPRVDGMVTARTSRAVPASAALATVENILAAYDISLVQTADVIQVVQRKKKKFSGGGIVTPDFRDQALGHGIHVFPLSFVGADAIRATLKPFIPPGRQLHADVASNVLLFAGNASEARDLEGAIELFDVDWMEGMSIGIFPLKYSDPAAVIGDLAPIFGQGKSGPIGGVVQFLPIERLSAILVITGRAVYLERAKTWIERLDRGGAGTGRRVFVYYVENTEAVALADTLNALFQPRTATVARGKPKRDVAPGLEAVDLAAPRAPGAPPIGGVGKPPVKKTRPARFGGDTAERAGEGINLGATFGADDTIRIIADERNNALLILASPSEYRLIEATIDRLDILPLQVLIEATIAEVTLNDDLKYGLNWFFEEGNFQNTLSAAAGGAVGASFPGFNVLFDTASARAVLNALADITDVNVISSPQLMVLDNQSARLQVGDQVPITTQAAVSVTDPDAPIVNSVTLIDTGVILEVTPHVNASGLVILDVVQEVSDAVRTTSSGIDSPTIRQRRIESTIAVQSGATVALGGLIRDSETTTESGIPFLMNIPIIGSVFKNTTNTIVRTELLVLITPRVVANQNDAREVTEELRRRLPALRPLEHKIVSPDG